VLRAEGLSLKGLVVGDGPEREFLRALADKLSIADQVHFTGAVSPERIPDFLEKADIFVLAPLSEGWGKSILEAMAFGLVCIGGNLGLMPTFLADQRGLTVRPGDVGALADILRKVVLAPERYSDMRLNASSWAQRYSLEGLRDALQKLMIDSWKLSGTALLRHDVPEIQ
jgi:glycosyltransferase involved in cell wall biosynthesis